MSWLNEYENYNLRIYQENQYKLKLREENLKLKEYKNFLAKQKRKELYFKLKSFLLGDF